MDFQIIYSNPYLRTLIAALIIYLAHVIFLVERIKKKLSDTVSVQDKQLEKQYDGTVLSTKSFIAIYDFLRKSRSEFGRLKDAINLNIWGGVVFMSGCVVGFISQISELSQDFGIMLMFTGGTIFIITIVQMIYWYVKN